jgi:hypothetical protein
VSIFLQFLILSNTCELYDAQTDVIKDSVLTAVSIVDNNDYGEFRNSTAFHFDSGEFGNSTAGKLIMM